jgi:hypothetical protein
MSTPSHFASTMDFCRFRRQRLSEYKTSQINRRGLGALESHWTDPQLKLPGALCVPNGGPATRIGGLRDRCAPHDMPPAIFRPLGSKIIAPNQLTFFNHRCCYLKSHGRNGFCQSCRSRVATSCSYSTVRGRSRRRRAAYCTAIPPGL